MKYIVIEYTNPEMDSCADHPSQITTMLDGGDLWPVTATCKSCIYDTETEAHRRLRYVFASRKADLEGSVRQPWAIVEGYKNTLFVTELDSEGRPKMDTSDWVYKVEVISIPETN